MAVRWPFGRRKSAGRRVEFERPASWGDLDDDPIVDAQPLAPSDPQRPHTPQAAPDARRTNSPSRAADATQPPAFIDVEAGRLVGMPHCSRLVDDGERLWCNAGDRAVAYDYSLRRLHETASGVRLAFPNYDPRDGDVTVPTFLNGAGHLVSIDLANGATRGTLVDTSTSSAFGLPITPATAVVDNLVIVADGALTAAVDVETREIVWKNEIGYLVREPWRMGDSLLVGDYDVYQLDLTTGEAIDSWNIEHGFTYGAKGVAWFSADSEQVARIALK